MTEEKLAECRFDYELQCYFCGAVHKPVEIVIPAGEKRIDWTGKCVNCGTTNQIRFYPVKPKGEPPCTAK